MGEHIEDAKELDRRAALLRGEARGKGGHEPRQVACQQATAAGGRDPRQGEGGGTSEGCEEARLPVTPAGARAQAAVTSAAPLSRGRITPCRKAPPECAPSRHCIGIAPPSPRTRTGASIRANAGSLLRATRLAYGGLPRRYLSAMCRHSLPGYARWQPVGLWLSASICRSVCRAPMPRDWRSETFCISWPQPRRGHISSGCAPRLLSLDPTGRSIRRAAYAG